MEGVAPDAVPYDELLAAEQPALLKGLVRRLAAGPYVVSGGCSQVSQVLLPGPPHSRVCRAPGTWGRFGYTPDATRLDFQSDRGLLDEYLDRVLSCLDDANAPSIYIGSTDVDVYLPGLRAANDLVLNHAMFEANPPMVGAWIGNRTTALAHHDMSHNIACVAVGRRRFTLFPPEQIENLYPGPLEPTPGGQVVTMADIKVPDFARFPKLREALAAAQVAEMEPGDALSTRAVVAPGRSTRRLQRHDQLLVEHRAAVHGYAAEHFAACAAQPA
jgi:hypothetical protein